jgi:hypothetical protein
MFLKVYAVVITIGCVGIFVFACRYILRAHNRVLDCEKKLREEKEKVVEALKDLSKAFEDLKEIHADALVMEVVLTYVGHLHIQRAIQSFKADATKVALQGLTLPLANPEIFRDMTRQKIENWEERVKRILSRWGIFIP